MSRWRRAVKAALAVNGLAVTGDASAVKPMLALPPAPAAMTVSVSRPKPDRVLVLGSAGVLVGAKGRLPRDGDVVHDGVALRIACKGGPIIIAGALRRISPGCRWVPVSALHRIDLAVVAAVAPAHLAEMHKRDRFAVLAANIATMLGRTSTGDAELDLRVALDIIASTTHATMMMMTTMT